MRFALRTMGLPLLLAIASLDPASLNAEPQDSIPSLMERTGTIRSRKLKEASGVAVSRRHPDLLWTHNDSGDKPVIYAVNRLGELLGSYAVPRARAVDWEDLALARCPENEDSCLYIADTGDNSERRKTVSIYVIPEPAPPSSDTAQTAPAREIRLRYPDGGHDVEAIYVDEAGDINLVTKGWTRGIVRYAVRRADFGRDTATAVLLDTLPIIPLRTMGRLVTGAARSPSGRRLVLRTYSELYFFSLARDGQLRADGKPCWLGAAEPQGEGVDFLDDETVILISESLGNQDGSLYQVRCAQRPGVSAAP
jgi:hypothetical protein